jgi:hypothetical protein
MSQGESYISSWLRESPGTQGHRDVTRRITLSPSPCHLIMGLFSSAETPVYTAEQRRLLPSDCLIRFLHFPCFHLSSVSVFSACGLQESVRWVPGLWEGP